ncbi:V/A-type H+-transporting ATPase subunit D [Alkalispirochaeta americana]|uniref:V/A-type H+-transporting ATPase subunit D n=1 Tax=Alkalispirochaeta americana TaxID=159291 RepID=A0A1N6P2I8_9SPIO|nr:V-type ATP synthase subunit D [Alkalispirochaeta americana]SIP98584.1 V/A-type H+-transporting ATPase subunit D [Alkalispirochaeta americana]
MVKLTKNELKKQKDALKRFQRYLPTLQLKKQQLQMVIRQAEQEYDVLVREKEQIRKDLDRWVGVYADGLDLTPYAEVERIETSQGNIAGIDIPVFEDLQFVDRRWDLVTTPLWVDQGVKMLRSMLEVEAKLLLLKEQLRLLSEELRTTTQRVNLFEKVKIPETKDNIRMIQIYLGDQQTAAVVRGKIAKRNLLKAAS